MKTQSLIHCFSWRLSYAVGTCGASQAVRGGAEGSQTRGGKKEQRGGRAERRGAQTSGGVAKGEGGDEECHQTETESKQSHQAVEPRAGGAAQPTPSDRWQSVHQESITHSFPSPN